MKASVKTFECSLPALDRDRRKWRQSILASAREHAGDGWDIEGPFEVVVLLYLHRMGDKDKHDVDNRLKDVLDALQGAFFTKADGKKRARKRRLIRNDSSVCRVVVEKQAIPTKYANDSEPPAGRLLVRRYKKRSWRQQVS